MPSPRPFWFASDELLTDLFRSEVKEVVRLVQKYPDVRKLLDSPEAILPQRTACFKLLAHCKLVDIIEDTFLGHHEQPPSLTEEEKDVLRRAINLVASDAPAWALEVNEVAEQLPHPIYDALPEPLRTGGYGYDPDNSAQVEIMRSAAKALSSVEQIQALTRGVFDQQLQRLEGRWSVTMPGFSQHHQAQADQLPITKASLPKPFEGLVRKNDLSRYSQYMDTLTEKQRLAFLLKFEYELGLTQIASRMGIDRKTADEHIKAAKKKIDQARSNERRKAHRAKGPLES